jgi:hypothetical protein
MFYGIQTKTVALGLFHDPAGPVFDLFGHGVIAKVDIRPSDNRSYPSHHQPDRSSLRRCSR